MRGSWIPQCIAVSLDCLDTSFTTSNHANTHIYILLPLLAHRMDDGSQRMYYTGQGKGGATAVGVAKLDMDANTWVRERATIVFADA